MKVLLVDSSLLVIQRLEEMLSEMNNVRTIHKALSYEEAKKMMNTDSFSLVVLDSGLRTGAIKLLKKIKKNTSPAYVIVLSNHYDDYILRECKTHGADFIFDKYHEFGKISGVIDEIVANRRNTRF